MWLVVLFAELMVSVELWEEKSVLNAKESIFIIGCPEFVGLLQNKIEIEVYGMISISVVELIVEIH